MALFCLIFYAAIFYSTAATSCEPDYEKIGCFRRTPVLLHDLLVNDRDSTHANFSGQHINWNDYGNYLHRFFAIGFYGECFAGHDSTMFEKMLKTGLLSSQECIDGEYAPCDQFSPMECSGKANAEYIYKLNNPPVKCDFKPGAGTGGATKFAGVNKSLKECIDSCVDMKDEYSDINGVTILASGIGECYCQRGQTGRNTSPRWQNCLLEM